VTAGHFVRGRPAAEQELLTYGAIRLVLPRCTIVFIVESLVNAHPAIVTVLEVISTPHATESAFGTMVGLIFL